MFRLEQHTSCHAVKRAGCKLEIRAVSFVLKVVCWGHEGFKKTVDDF